MSDGQIDRTWEDATRIGTSALLAYAIISFVANIVLPIFVTPTSGQVSETTVHQDRIVYPENEVDDETGQAEEPLLDGTPHKIVEEKPTWLTRLQIPGLTLRRAWLLSHLLFAVCMFSTFFISSYPAGSVVIGFVGISWALTLWAPFALISAEVARTDVTRHSHRHETGGTGSAAESGRANNTASGSYAPVSGEDDPENVDHNDADDHDLENGHPKPLPVNEEENVAQAGIVLGLHNVAVSFPQIFSSLICSAIFKAAQKPRGEPWDDSVGWVLRFGGCAALVAAWLTKRLAEGSQ